MNTQPLPDPVMGRLTPTDHDTRERTPAAKSGPDRRSRGRNRIVADDAGGADARTRIQDVALRLFIDEGYDKTSLREIAEQLGVTKAALYYHFPTKEDIVTSLIDERIGRIDELVQWARQQPRTAQTRRELIRRYAMDLHNGERHHTIMRFFERNQTVVKTLGAGQRMRQSISRLIDLLAEPEEPLEVQLRRALAVLAIHAGSFLLVDREATDIDRRTASLTVALELLDDHGRSA
jgi:AcrR family transcriptional regulator